MTPGASNPALDLCTLLASLHRRALLTPGLEDLLPDLTEALLLARRVAEGTRAQLHVEPRRVTATGGAPATVSLRGGGEFGDGSTAGHGRPPPNR